MLLLLVGAQMACSVKFAYNNMDRYIRWQVNDYLDLDTSQRAYFSQELDALIRWHRITHLPQYAAYIDSLSVQFSDGVSEAQIAAMFAQFLLWGDEIEQRGLPIAITLMRSLTDAQVAQLPERLEQSNVELAEDEAALSLADAQAQWADDFADVMARFTGRLERDQKAYLRRRAMAYQPEMALWAEYRRRWQADLLKVLAYRDEPRFAADFRALAAARESYYGPEYTAINNANIALSRELASHLLSNLNERQARRMQKTLSELARDLAELADPQRSRGEKVEAAAGA